MTSEEDDGLRRLAAECVTLAAGQFGRSLDGSLASMDELDAVCADLLADGPLEGQRLDLWWKLIGAYSGEVLVRVYGGQWITHEQAPGSYAISVYGITAFPFAITNKILSGEPDKSLASFARVLPAIVAHSQQKEMVTMTGNDPMPQPEPDTTQDAEDPGYLTETGQAVGDDGSVVPIIGGLPAAEGSAWDIGAPADERGAGLAEELGGSPEQAGLDDPPSPG